MSTGARIAQLRCARQWSQTYLAQKVGTNVKSVTDWENDVSNPSVCNVKKLCAIFNTTADFLLELDNKPVVVLNGLSAEDEVRARALLQTFIDTSKSPYDDSRTNNSY